MIDKHHREWDMLKQLIGDLDLDLEDLKKLKEAERFTLLLSAMLNTPEAAKVIESMTFKMKKG